MESSSEEAVRTTKWRNYKGLDCHNEQNVIPKKGDLRFFGKGELEIGPGKSFWMVAHGASFQVRHCTNYLTIAMSGQPEVPIPPNFLCYYDLFPPCSSPVLARSEHFNSRPKQPVLDRAASSHHHHCPSRAQLPSAIIQVHRSINPNLSPLPPKKKTGTSPLLTPPPPHPSSPSQKPRKKPSIIHFGKI